MAKYITPRNTTTSGKPLKKATKIGAMGAGQAIEKAGKATAQAEQATTLATALKALGILL